MIGCNIREKALLLACQPFEPTVPRQLTVLAHCTAVIYPVPSFDLAVHPANFSKACLSKIVACRLAPRTRSPPDFPGFALELCSTRSRTPRILRQTASTSSLDELVLLLSHCCILADQIGGIGSVPCLPQLILLPRIIVFFQRSRLIFCHGFAIKPKTVSI